MNKKLREARIMRGLSQCELAEKAKTRQDLLSLYESGKRHIPTNTARRLSKILGVKVYEIISNRQFLEMNVKHMSESKCKEIIESFGL